MHHYMNHHRMLSKKGIIPAFYSFRFFVCIRSLKRKKKEKILFSDKFHRNVHTILLIRFVLEGFAAGAFIYVACVEILSSEMSVHNHGTRQGLFKALAVIISLFTFFFVNIIFGQRLHYSLRYFNIL